MNALKNPDLISVEEYLAGEQESPVKHEYLGGTVHAMAGATNDHNDIAGNAFAFFHRSLRGSSCRPSNSDTKVRVETRGAISFYYPDGLVSCDRNDGKDTFQSKPVLIIEVISPSTQRIDRYEKLTAYTSLPSLQYYLIVEQSKIAVTLHRRKEEDLFEEEHYRSSDDRIELPDIKATLVVGDLYEGIDFSPQ